MTLLIGSSKWAWFLFLVQYFGWHVRSSPFGKRHDSSFRHRWIKEATTIQEYELWDSNQIKEELERWASHYPQFVRLTTSQDAYGLPTAGRAEDCPFDEGDGCKNYILTLQDFEAYPEGSEASRHLPEVLWSGEVHGDERVGPTAVLEATSLLLSAAACEALPRRNLMPEGDDEEVQKAWERERQLADNCRMELRQFGIEDQHRKWLARLLSTRRLVVVPTANALGYYRSERTENGVDANRDFPFDLTDPKQCMTTIAGRTLNEVFREHLFQLSLTFHGGTEVVSYEWGAPSYEGFASPDDIAQSAIGGAYSRFAGGWSTTKPYIYGNMNELVYPVRGGMEDWAYAGSWDPDRVISCEPDSFGGYPKEKTIYNNSTLRVFNMLIETSHKKIPHKSTLGTSMDVMRSDTEANGHVSRNIRLALLSLELVQPYLSIASVNGYSFIDDVVPQYPQKDSYSCKVTKALNVSSALTELTIQWTVGGALDIDDTQLWYGKWDDLLMNELNCWSQPSTDVLKDVLKKASPIGTMSGKGAFATGSPVGGAGATFSALVDMSSFEAGDEIIVIAMAEVDKGWKDQPKNIKPQVPPQSHMVNARTNPEWYHETDGSVIQGRVQWFSMPATLYIVSSSTSKTIIETQSRYTNSNASPTSSSAEAHDKKGEEAFVTATTLLIVVAIVGVILLMGQIILKKRFRIAKRNRVLQYVEGELVELPGISQQNGYADQEIL
ncbi:hypothetical protein FisN_1Hh444 [Fistulifera solaris]|uniref:Peptidase M14 domain-containing protein n=1 Tax=Fistulifera solaris TaxID=1519565 RepID=A0A1Z5JJR0_FISSO|nr:hypothetical protein FisN_1Hh444 [Fistulifera solaris]|eukprot:GAX14250.1 hypothetical protein FisN_1Hh444 [Fistulifera solaris]